MKKIINLIALFLFAYSFGQKKYIKPSSYSSVTYHKGDLDLSTIGFVKNSTYVVYGSILSSKSGQLKLTPSSRFYYTEECLIDHPNFIKLSGRKSINKVPLMSMYVGDYITIIKGSKKIYEGYNSKGNKTKIPCGVYDILVKNKTYLRGVIFN